MKNQKCLKTYSLTYQGKISVKDMIEKTIIKIREQSIQEEERELYGMGCCFVFYSLMIIKFSKLRRSAFERGEGRERGDL